MDGVCRVLLSVWVYVGLVGVPLDLFLVDPLVGSLLG